MDRIHNLISDDKIRLYILLALLCSITCGFFINLNGYLLFDVDEGAFSAASREMLLHRDFVSITLNGEPRYDKPVLIYWLQAASAYVFGNEAGAYRLPSVLASLVWVYLIYWFTRKQFDHDTGLIAALFMSSTIQIALMGKAATADATLNLFIAGSMFNLFLYLKNASQSNLYWAVGFVALGTLTKGPIAIAIPAIVGLLYTLTTPGLWRRTLRIVYQHLAWMIFLVIVLPWPVILILREGGDFFREFLLVHNVGRFSKPMEGHAGSYAYYFIALLAGFVPYSFLLLYSLSRFKSLWNQDLQRYLLIWFGFIFVFFTFSATKLPHYLIYGSSGLFILMALQARELEQKVWLFIPQLLFCIIFLALPAVLEFYQQQTDDEQAILLLTALPQAFTQGYYVILVLTVIISLVFILERKFPWFLKLALSGIMLNLFIALFLLPAIGVFQQQPVREAGLMARTLSSPLVNWRINMPSFNIYAERPSLTRAPQAGDIVFTKSKFIHSLPEHRVLYQKRGITLLGIEPFTVGDHD
jgi:4-amino-4-deoxy-L-arabinose transferase-like glycosyltransferase